MKPKKPRKTADPSTPIEAPSAPHSDPRIGLLVFATAVSALLVCAASFLPGARLWGINHLAFFAPPVRWIATAVIAIAFVPAVARPLYRLLLRGAERVGNAEPRVTGVAVVVIAALSVLGFNALRSSTLLLGDGQLIVRSFEAAEEGHNTVVMRSPHAIVTEEVIAPGATLLYYGASKVATGPLKETPLFGLQALNCLLGGMFMFLLLWVATSRPLGAEDRTWLIFLTLFSCSIELFFGYVENYTAPFLFLSAYTVAAFRALHHRGSRWLPVLPLILAVYSHIQSVLFVPSFVYLLVWTGSPRRRGALLRFWTPVFACAAMIGVVAASAVPQLKRFYVPFGFRNDEYALLAPHHLADVVIEVFMLLPIVLLVIAMLWVTLRAERASGRDFGHDPRAAKDPVEWLSHPAEWQFSTTILIPCALYLGLFHPEIGMARDWDLFTMTTIAVVPLVLLTLHRYQAATGAATDAVARFAVPAFAVLVVTGTAWVGVNASVDRTVGRFERILTYDRTHAAYAWENLAMLYHERGQLDKAIETIRIASDESHNPRQYTRLAVYLDEAGQTDAAIKVLDDVLARRPAFSKARFRLVMFLEKKQDWTRMLDVAKEGVAYNPEEPTYQFFYGESLRRAGKIEEAMAIFRGCQDMDLPPPAKEYVKKTLANYDRTGK